MEIIVATNADWGIGMSGSQTIVIPGDRRHFRELTTGNTVIVGRKTLVDFPNGAPLPKRTNIVFTRDRDLCVGGAVTVHSLRELAEALRGYPPERVFVIGGASVYALLLPYCTRAHVTRINASPDSDVFFRNLDETSGWALRERGPVQLHGDTSYSFDIYENTDTLDIQEA